MGPVTYYVALPFVWSEDGELVAGEAQERQTSTAAVRAAQSLSTTSAGAVAFSRTGDPSTGDFSDAEIIPLSGRCPTSIRCSPRLEMTGNTLASYPYVVVRLGCSRCGRQGQYRLARLAAKYGSEIEMNRLLEHLASDCAMWGRQRHPFKEACGASFVDTDSPRPPELPAAMRALKVVR